VGRPGILQGGYGLDGQAGFAKQFPPQRVNNERQGQ
jgi:hypothetical protein